MVGEEPSDPEEVVIWTPATMPSRARVTSDYCTFRMSSESTTVAEPVKDSLVAVPNSTTMVSSSICLSGCSEISTVLPVLTSISDVTYPIEEKLRAVSPGTVSVKFPSPSVVPPSSVPFIWMDANGIPSPVSASFTTPLTVPSCPCNAVHEKMNVTARKNLNIFIS